MPSAFRDTQDSRRFEVRVMFLNTKGCIQEDLIPTLPSYKLPKSTCVRNIEVMFDLNLNTRTLYTVQFTQVTSNLIFLVLFELHVKRAGYGCFLFTDVQNKRIHIRYWPAGRSVFSLYGPTQSRSITCLSSFPAVNCLTSGFIYATFSLNWLTRLLQTIRKKSNERTSERLRC